MDTILAYKDPFQFYRYSINSEISIQSIIK